MSRRARALLAGAAALLLLALAAAPAGAAVKPGWVEKERRLVLEFRAPAANGYELTVTTEGHRRVTATLEKGGVAVSYETAGQVSRKGIEAEFGALGSIDVRLRDARRVRLDSHRVPSRLLRRKCSGRKTQHYIGRFAGTIELVGDGGFSAVEVDSAKGSVERSYRRLCKKTWLEKVLDGGGKGDDVDSGGLRLAMLVATGKSGGGDLRLEAFKIEPGQGLFGLEELLGTIVSGRLTERREGVRIKRTAIYWGESSDLQISPRGKSPTRAKLTLTRPFEGTAALLQPRGEPTNWTGPLLLRLPGAGGVPMTGPGISARLCRVELSISDQLNSLCLKEPGAAKGYCSKPCSIAPPGTRITPGGATCEEVGMVCEKATKEHPILGPAYCVKKK